MTAMHHLAANGGRGKGMMELYLHSCCIADWVIKRVWSPYARDNDTSLVGNNDGVESPWPRLWDGVYDISIFIETPMHLIFHGVLPDVVEVIDEFLAEHKLQKGFHDRVNGILLDVIALRLEWCKMKTLPKKNNN